MVCTLEEDHEGRCSWWAANEDERAREAPTVREERR